MAHLCGARSPNMHLLHLLFAPEGAIQQKRIAVAQVRFHTFVQGGQAREKDQSSSRLLIDKAIANSVTYLRHGPTLQVAWWLAENRKSCIAQSAQRAISVQKLAKFGRWFAPI